MGLPIAEPYWAVVPVGGVDKWVLMQPYERRVVTYTPDTEPAFQVETGNIALHYMRWRHEKGTCEDPAETPVEPEEPQCDPATAMCVAVIPDSGTPNTAFTFVIEGFTPGEPIGIWFTDPEQWVWYPPERQVRFPDDVDTIILTLVPAQSFREVLKGRWAFTAQGVNSGRQGVAYFTIR